MASRAMLSLVEPNAAEGTAVSVLLNANLATIGGEYPVRIREISCSGAVIEGEKLPRPGSDIVLTRGSLECFCSVLWVRDRRCGLDFEEPVDEGQLLLLLHENVAIPPASGERFRRPRLAGEKLTPDEWEIVQAWGTNPRCQPLGE